MARRDNSLSREGERRGDCRIAEGGQADGWLEQDDANSRCELRVVVPGGKSVEGRELGEPGDGPVVDRSTRGQAQPLRTEVGNGRG